MKEHVRLGEWDREQIEEILQVSSDLSVPSARIDFISRQFLAVPYKTSTLIGSPDNPEVFVINLEAVDCFTFIDYVEAMRLSRSFRGFREQLRRVRYRSGRVGYDTRRHFFTDWLSTRRVRNATPEIGRRLVIAVRKVLNEKDDGSCFLPDIRPISRKITYIPATDAVSRTILSRLRTGDYVGIYTEAAGLDVSHVGIFIDKRGKPFFRHASLMEKKVVDRGFAEYLTGKPGIVVLRPADPHRR